MLVDDHEVHRELLQTEILVGEQHLPGHVQVFAVADSQQQDRQVARDALSPEPALRSAARLDGLGLRT